MRVGNILDPIHSTLDARVWDKPATAKPVLKTQHAHWIKARVYHVLGEVGGYTDIEKWLTLYFTGSLTTYQYSETSDCDISLFVDSKVFPEWSRAEMIGLVVEHLDGTTLPGTPFPLQDFVVPEGIKPHDIYKPGLRSAYSIDTGRWIVPPERERAHDVKAEEGGFYAYALQMADKMEKLLRYEPDKAIMFWHQIHKRRQRDMKAGKGDFSEANIIYKFLANRGLMPAISDVSGEHIAAAWSPEGYDFAPHRWDEECYNVAEEVARKHPELKQESGFYIHPTRGTEGHSWNVAPDGTVIDTTAEQHREYEGDDPRQQYEYPETIQYRTGPSAPEIISPEHPHYERYVSYESQPEKAMQLAHQEGDHHDPKDYADVCPQCASPEHIAKTGAAPHIKYHVSWEDKHPTIMERGLLPGDPGAGDGNPSGNYLFHDLADAQEHSRSKEEATWEPAIKPAIYEVDTSGFPLAPDPSMPEAAVYTNQPIPPERIKRVAKTGAEFLPPEQEGYKEKWEPGEKAHFEYHCYKSHDSQDAQLWYRSHQPVTVIEEPAENAENRAVGSFAERGDAGMPVGYRIRFGDGLEHTAMEDELYTHPKFLHPKEGPPPDAQKYIAKTGARREWYHPHWFRAPSATVIREVPVDELYENQRARYKAKIHGGPSESTLSKTVTRVADIIWEATVEEGGVTLNLAGELPNNRYGFAPHKESEERIPAELFTVQDVESFIEANMRELAQPGKYIGTWTTNGQVFLDVTEGHDDFHEAFQRAWDGHQKSMWDGVAQEEIPVRGLQYEPVLS